MGRESRADGEEGSARTARTGWSLRIGRLFGIPLRVHVTFPFILIWYGLDAARMGGDAALAVAYILAVFAFVVLHELGHAGMGRVFGVRTREIVLYPIGGIARLDRFPTGFPELLIAFAGP